MRPVRISKVKRNGRQVHLWILIGDDEFCATYNPNGDFDEAEAGAVEGIVESYMAKQESLEEFVGAAEAVADNLDHPFGPKSTRLVKAYETLRRA